MTNGNKNDFLGENYSTAQSRLKRNLLLGSQMTPWQIAQKHEVNWWGNCVNTFGEETKQLVYARLMGLQIWDDGNSPFNIMTGARTVLDIGGGPVSMLLKFRPVYGSSVTGTVVDPANYPSWVSERYANAGITYYRVPGELIHTIFVNDEIDLGIIYNCLQHTEKPEKIVQNMRRCCKEVRIFEWIDHPTNEMHPHVLTAGKLNEWFGGVGSVLNINEGGCVGNCYYGTFKCAGLA